MSWTRERSSLARLGSRRAGSGCNLFGALALGLVGACREPPPPSPHDDAAAPADHLAEGEIPEGMDKAFALPLPLASTVSMRFRETIHVRSSLGAAELANFVRARVKSQKNDLAKATTFEDVIVPAEPARHLTIEIRSGRMHSGVRSEMIVRDVTPPPPADPNASEAELRRRAGLTPDGKLLDPKHMQ